MKGYHLSPSGRTLTNWVIRGREFAFPMKLIRSASLHFNIVPSTLVYRIARITRPGSISVSFESILESRREEGLKRKSACPAMVPEGRYGKLRILTEANRPIGPSKNGRTTRINLLTRRRKLRQPSAYHLRWWLAEKIRMGTAGFDSSLVMLGSVA